MKNLPQVVFRPFKVIIYCLINIPNKCDTDMTDENIYLMVTLRIYVNCIFKKMTESSVIQNQKGILSLLHLNNKSTTLFMAYMETLLISYKCFESPQTISCKQDTSEEDEML